MELRRLVAEVIHPASSLPLNRWLDDIRYPYCLQLCEGAGDSYTLVVGPSIVTGVAVDPVSFSELRLPTYEDLTEITNPFGWMT
jgi:hypothetical protein